MAAAAPDILGQFGITPASVNGGLAAYQITQLIEEQFKSYTPRQLYLLAQRNSAQYLVLPNTITYFSNPIYSNHY